MGRQIQFHALSKDIQMFLQFVQQHDPVIVAVRDSDSPDVTALENPASVTDVMTLWNRELASPLGRKRVMVQGRDYYTFEGSAPTLELSPSRLCEWNGREALLSGRIYREFDTSILGYERWYNSLVRWIRKHFVKSPLPLVLYVGPAAYDWYKRGGVLLPMMIPPAITPTWLSWVEAQDQHRAMFSK